MVDRFASRRRLVARAGRYAFLAVLTISGARGVSAPGVDNFHQVNDHLYRGAQPTEHGFRSLAQLGVRTVVDLRIPEERSNEEQKLVKSLGMHYVHIPVKGRRFPTDGEVQKTLAILNDASAWPVFVHCREGKDRTGTMIACYRVAHDQWTNMRALAEAKSYGMHKVERAMQEYILHFQPRSVLSP